MRNYDKMKSRKFNPKKSKKFNNSAKKTTKKKTEYKKHNFNQTKTPKVALKKKSIRLKKGEGVEQTIEVDLDVKKKLINSLKEEVFIKDSRFYGKDTKIESIRINRFLAKCGLGSRRDVEQFILEGKISVNGIVETNLSKKIVPFKDEVKFEDSIIRLRENEVILAFNKPIGYLCSHMDVHHEKTVFQLLPSIYKKLNMAGRLDITSRGLMIFSSDGNLIQKLSHPSHRLRKKYLLKVENCQDEQFLREKFFQGIEDQGELLRAVEVEVLDRSSGNVMVGLEEGKKRQLHRMFNSVGCKILDLQRVQIGKLKLEDLDLKEGESREIQKDDIFY